jgi:hypothetical protein
VEARWRPVRRGAAASMTDEWFPAEVLAQHADGTYTVRINILCIVCSGLLLCACSLFIKMGTLRIRYLRV